MRTIRARLTASYALLLLATLVGLSLALYAAMAHALQSAARDSVRALGEQATRVVVSGSGDNPSQGGSIDVIDSSLSETLARGGLYLEVRDTNGTVLSRSPALQGHSLAEPKVIEKSGPQTFEQTLPNVGHLVTYVAPINQNGRPLGTVAAGRSLTETDQTLARLRTMLAVGDGIAVIIAALGGWWLAGAALRPVDRLTRTARFISARALSQRLRLNGPDDELHRLAAAFDEMLDRLEDAFDRERQFTTDAAHELKTPLTILRGEIDVAMRKVREVEDYRRTLPSLRDEVERMSRLVDDLLLLARTDAGKAPLNTQTVRIAAFAQNIADRFAARAASKSVALKLAGPPDAAIEVDVSRFSQTMDNLVDNAIAHTPAGGEVTIRWHHTATGAIIEVADTGAGIPPEHLPHIFQRFYRVDSHRSREAGGAGLGLAIAKQIVEAHGGTMSVASKVGEGTTFTIKLTAERSVAPPAFSSV
jgi:heavy metal sensor kinase